MLGGAAEDRDELVVPEWLLDVIEGAFIHRLHRRLKRRLRRHENHRDIWVARASGGKNLDAADVRHPNVRENDVWVQLLHLLEPSLSAVRDVRRESLVPQQNVE